VRPLDDIRVLEIGEGLAGAWCTRLLGGLGATVLKIEPLHGDRTRRVGPLPAAGPPSVLFRFLNAGKRSLALDLHQSSARAQLARLASRCDVLVETLPPGGLAALGAAPSALRRSQPALVVVSLTPFGQQGPRAAWRADELVLQAEGGLLGLTGAPAAAPRRVAGPLAQLLGGLHGAIAALAALVGQTGGWIDLSLAATVTGALEGATTEYAYAGAERQRAGNRRPRNHPMTVLPCQDGYAGIFVASPADWELFARFAGHPEWATDARFATPAGRRAHADALDALLKPWLAQWERAALFAAAQAWRLPFAMALHPDELPADPHLRARGFWSDNGLPGAPLRLAGAPWHSGPAPHLDDGRSLAERWLAGPPRRGPAPGAGQRPLASTRVLDLTALWAGPYATRLLADLGAEVVKVEGPWRPDGTRGPARAAEPAPIYPEGQPGQRPYDRAALFNELNRNKRGIALDLATSRGQALLRDLIAQADVLIESFSPRVLPNWGLDDAALQRLQPRLVVVHMPAFGRDGPYRDGVALGDGLDLMSGVATLTGAPGPPLLAGVAWPDPMAGATAALATLAGLRWRDRAGRGAHVEVAQWEVALQLVAPWVAAGAATAALPAAFDPPAAPRGVYPSRDDDRWLALSVTSAEAWAGLCAVLQADDLVRDVRFADAAGRVANAPALDAAIAARTRLHEAEALVAALQAAGVAAGVVRRPSEMLHDAQLEARGYFLTIAHPAAGTHAYPGVPWRCDAWPGPPVAPAPCFGEHNRTVLQAWLGLDEAALNALANDGVLGSVPAV
jgi:crotonobetainyl-CoA:carnitine CoA-transferase CaiB-like acyl-CoA transferase